MHLMGDGPGAILSFETFLSLTGCLWLYNTQLKTSRGVLFLPPSDAYVRSFLYLLYTLTKLYYTKALNGQASSLTLDWIFLLRGPRIPASWFNNNLSYSNHKETFFSIWCCVYLRWWMFTKPTVVSFHDVCKSDYVVHFKLIQCCKSIIY